MHVSRHIAICAVVTLLVAMAADGYDQPAERRATDEFVERLRKARTQSVVNGSVVRGRDNDSVIDAYMDVIAHYEGEDRQTAMWFLRMGVGIREWAPASGPRRLDFMLPARVAPVLLAALREEPRAARYDLMELLGSIDEPGPAVIATVGRELSRDDAGGTDDAIRAAAMLGTEAAELAPELERMLDAADPTRPTQRGAGNVLLVRRANIAGALARVTDPSHDEALRVLIDAVDLDDGAAGFALGHLRHLGRRAAPAVDVLLEHLGREMNQLDHVVEAILGASPDALPAVLPILVDRATEGAEATANDHELRLILHGAARADGELTVLAAALRRVATASESRSALDPSVARIVGPLALVSDDANGRALAALTEIARGEHEGAGKRAVQFLAELGPAARPATDDLVAILGEQNAARPPVASAILTISPDLQPTILPPLLALAVSHDAEEAAFAERELSALVENRRVRWLDSAEMRAAVPALIAAVEARPVADGKTPAEALRRINTPESREAYNAYVRRAGAEKRGSNNE